jgi:hypothetical protein
MMSRKSKRKIKKGLASQIDQLLLAPVKTTQNGKPSTMPTIVAIVRQLLQKSLAGSSRADRTLLAYKQFANRFSTGGMSVIFVDNDYTRTLASKKKDDNV